MAHIPVLLEEAVSCLVQSADGIYVDGTFGRGGHASLILAHLSDRARLLVMDRDPAAIDVAKVLVEKDERVTASHSAFSGLKGVVESADLHLVDGVLLDLGVSSPQLDQSERGFSFMHDGPLDMRMDVSTGETASAWLARVSFEELRAALKAYGEERSAGKIAARIVESRDKGPITSTHQLADIVASVLPRGRQKRHPATKTFQAIRIVINQELRELEAGLAAAVSVLAPRGRLVVISFHSLEDRATKQFMRRLTAPPPIPRKLPVRNVQFQPDFKLVGKWKPSAAEVDRNPRARSAVMRVLEKVA